MLQTACRCTFSIYAMTIPHDSLHRPYFVGHLVYELFYKVDFHRYHLNRRWSFPLHMYGYVNSETLGQYLHLSWALDCTISRAMIWERCSQSVLMAGRKPFGFKHDRAVLCYVYFIRKYCFLCRWYLGRPDAIATHYFITFCFQKNKTLEFLNTNVTIFFGENQSVFASQYLNFKRIYIKDW